MPIDYSIPLQAQVAKPINPFETLGQVLQVKQMQESNRALAEQRYALADQRRFALEQERQQAEQAAALRQLKQWTPETVFPIVGPEAGAKILKGIEDFRSTEVKSQGELFKVIGSTVGAIKALPSDELRAEAYKMVGDTFVSRGWAKPDELLPYSPEALDFYQQQALTGEQQVTTAETAKHNRAAESHQTATLAETGRHNIATEGQATTTAKETARHNRAVEAATAARLKAESAGAESPMSPEGLQIAAWQYIQTGSMPPLGMGKQAAAARMRIINEAGRIAKAGGGDPVLNSALYKADSQALTQQQKSLSAITAFENTAKQNLKVMEDAAKKIVDTGVPWINQPLRAIGERAGSPELAAFNTARQAVIPEIARILTNPNLSGVLSDSARHEIDQMLRGDASMSQMLASIKILRTDMDTRRKSLVDEIDAITSRISSRGASSTGRGNPPAPAAAPGSGNVRMVAPDGRALSVPTSEVARLEALGARRAQ
jgi:hypothetical protein